MKVLKTFGMLLTAITVISCSSSDDPTTSGELVGKWYYKEYRAGGETYPYEDHEPCGKDYVQFNADGTGVNVDVWDCELDAAPFSYTRSGNSISITSDGETDTVQIVELSSTTLQVTYNDDFDEDGDNDTVIEVFTKN